MSEKDSTDKRRRLDSVIPELIKRAVELGVEKASEAPDNLKELVTHLKLPREAASLLLAHADETKNDLFRVVGKEVRHFLEHTNLASEMQKLLTTVQFEISTTIRFKPNPGHTDPGRMPKPEVKSEMRVKRGDDGARPRPGSERRRNRES
jgi:hypothetical protein